MRGLIRLIIILLAIVQSIFFWKIKKSVPKKILIAHDLLLGDTLLLAPLMKRIHEKYPDAKKFILVKPGFIPLFANTPYGFKALSFNPKIFLDIWKIFSFGPYDLTYIAGDNRYSWLARAIGARWIVGIGEDNPKWKNLMLDEAKSFDLNPATWADMMARLVDGKEPGPYKKNEWPRPHIKKTLSLSSSKSYVVCHLGASNPLKFWPAESWKVLIDKLKHKGFEIFISVGPGEEYLLREADPDSKCQHISGTYSLLEMWYLIERANLLISVDTGIAHLAKLSNTPIVTLFGPGSPATHGVGNFWKLNPHMNITVSSFPCRDQKILFRRNVQWVKRCGRGVKECRTPGACMEAIAPKQVLNTLLNSNLFSGLMEG
ncbi:RfaF ADP-heptose,LPS heptosyltransferase [Candidatus Methylopumilus universalis]|uniref:glycosyltransferase family 9 protein n=1 Tax=Candidatus Methylopumilus universalis TaxID=2588536 RepID=UPI003BEEE731